MVKKADRPQHVIKTALSLAAAGRWSLVSLGEIAESADIPIAELHAMYPSKMAILKAYFDSVDAAVLETKFAFDEKDGPRDRLFDVLMRRFDTLAENRDAVIGILRALRCDPIAALCLAPGLAGSMRWMLEAAGVRAVGLNGRLIVKGLAAVWLATLQVWQGDESEDMSRTMAALDRNLRRAERLSALLPSARRTRRSEEPQQEPSPA
jgi:AcrR family transcriptional regulator